MKKVTYILLLFMALMACKKDKVDANKTKLELISQNTWQLDRYTTTSGEPLNFSDLNTQAQLLFVMNFEFRADGEVRGVDKTSKQIIDRGVWTFINNETAVNVKLGTLDYDFDLVVIKTGQLTLQAPTGNFLTGLGDRINLEFSNSN